LKQRLLNNSTFFAWTVLSVLTFIWGSSYILIKIGLEYYPPDELGAARIAIAFIVLLPFAIKHLKSVSKDKLIYLFLVGLLGNLIPSYLFALAETNLESSLAGIINTLTPLFTVIVAYFFLKHRITYVQLTGLLLGIFGCTGISLINQQDGGFGTINIYAWLVVLATVLYAFTMNLIKYHFQDMSAIALASLSIFFSGPIATGYILTTNFFQRSADFGSAGKSLGAILILSLFGTAFAIILFNKLIQIKGPVFSSTVTFLMPLVAILWGLADGEKLFFLHYIGLALTLIGVYLTNRKT